MTEPDADCTSTHSRDWSAPALVAVVVAFLFFNAVASWLLSDGGNDNALLSCLFFGVWVLEPMILGVWMALGPGSWLTRLPMTIPCLLMLLVAPGINPSADAQFREFIAVVIAGLVIFVVATALFVVVRWRTGLRMLSPANKGSDCNSNLRFNIKYLLILTMLCAIVLATVSRLRFLAEPPPPSFLGGFDFFLVILIIGGATLSALVLPTLAVPLMILYRRPSKRAIRRAVALWAIMTLLLTTYFTLDDEVSWFNVLGYVLAAQLGPVVAGVFTGSLLQLAGWRLVGYQSDAAHQEMSSPTPSP